MASLWTILFKKFHFLYSIFSHLMIWLSIHSAENDGQENLILDIIFVYDIYNYQMLPKRTVTSQHLKILFKFIIAVIYMNEKLHNKFSRLFR